MLSAEEYKKRYKILGNLSSLLVMRFSTIWLIMNEHRTPRFSPCPTTSWHIVRVEFFTLLIIQSVRYAPKQLFTLMPLIMIDIDPQLGE